jgi:hypothetical protein
MSSESNMKTDLADTCQGVDGNQYSCDDALCIKPFCNAVLDDVCCCSSFRQMQHLYASVVRTCQDLQSISRLQCDLSPGLPGLIGGCLIEDALDVDPSVDKLNSCLMVTGDCLRFLISTCIGWAFPGLDFKPKDFMIVMDS